MNLLKAGPAMFRIASLWNFQVCAVALRVLLSRARSLTFGLVRPPKPRAAWNVLRGRLGGCQQSWSIQWAIGSLVMRGR
jgi:hypothetical protein